MSFNVLCHDRSDSGPITVEWITKAPCVPHFRLCIGHELIIFPTVERLCDLHQVIGLALMQHEAARLAAEFATAGIECQPAPLTSPEQTGQGVTA